MAFPWSPPVASAARQTIVLAFARDLCDTASRADRVVTSGADNKTAMCLSWGLGRFAIAEGREFLIARPSRLRKNCYVGECLHPKVCTDYRLQITD